MKLLAGLLLLASANTFAATCPSIDNTIRMGKAGMATTLEIERAILCQVDDICSLKIAILGDVVQLSKRRMNAGDMTPSEVASVEQELADARADCSK